MKLVVFGATGRTGRLVVEQALRQGHEVAAVVRNAAKLGVNGERLNLVEANLEDTARIEGALAGADAVISALGSGQGTLTRFARIIVPAMQRAGVNRIVSLVGAGVAEPGDPSSIGRTIMLSVMKLLAGEVLADAAAHAELLRRSGLEWTLVRPPRLTDGPATGALTHGPALALGPAHQISRADLAGFMIEVEEKRLYIRQSPMVAARR